MTSVEYSKAIRAYDTAMSLKKSLKMTIRQNEMYIKGYTAMPRDKRQIVIDNAKKNLAELIIPKKPIQSKGFDIITTEDTFFAPTDDINIAKEWADDGIMGTYDIKPSKRAITTDHQGLTY